MSAVSPLGHPDAIQESLRLAIVGSPRSGNTWLRGLLANVLGLEELAFHDPAAVGWETLPPRCALQLHWHPTDDFRGLLVRYGFRVVTPTRHPLDLLLSVLNYAYYTHDPAICTRTACATCSILGVSPRSEQFLAYTRGKYATDILAISRNWWARPETIRVRYEDLVLDTPAELRRIINELGASAQSDPEEVTARFAIDSLRSRHEVMHYHYWQGRPNYWRSFLTAETAAQIAEVHPGAFATFGYACDPNPNLDPVQADLNWYRQQLQSTRLHLRNEREKHQVTRQQLEATRSQLDHVHEILWLEREQHRRSQMAANGSGSSEHSSQDIPAGDSAVVASTG